MHERRANIVAQPEPPTARNLNLVFSISIVSGLLYLMVGSKRTPLAGGFRSLLLRIRRDEHHGDLDQVC